MNTTQIISTIKNLGLLQAVRRELTLFLLTVLARGYTKTMRQRFGFSYEAAAIIGNKEMMEDYLNVSRLAEGMEMYLQQFSSPEDAFGPLRGEFSLFERRTKEVLSSVDPFQVLAILSEFAPSYYAVLGFYNAYWRYLDQKKKEISSELRDVVAKERNRLAVLYPLQEQAITKITAEIGKQLGFDGSLLKMATVPEMKDFLATRSLSPNLLVELKKRQDQYFYLYVEGEPEIVITDKKDIAHIRKECFPEEEVQKVNALSGQVAYPGKAQGKVVILQNGLKDIPKGSILVAHSTHPKDLPIIKKAAAIVTEEGGVLSHAAIIARELKIPTVIGVKGATKVFKDGDLVEVDAKKGTVRKVP